jgi:hypothetical protein
VGGLAAVASVAVPVSWGWLRNWYPDVHQLWVILFNPGTLLILIYVGFSIGVLKVTGSTRQAAIAVFTCFVIGFVILTYVGAELRGPNWDFYWSESAWPAH